jgi:hypothetical protein
LDQTIYVCSYNTGRYYCSFNNFFGSKPDILFKNRVIASGGAGTWFTFGYLIYIVVGVIGVAVSAIFYHYLEGV